MDWSVVPISAVVSAAVAITIRWLDKPRPRLVATERGVLLPAGNGAMREAIGVPVTLANHGSGPAYDLLVAGSGCVVGIRQPKSHAYGAESWDDRIPVLPAGESVVLDVQGWDPGGKSSGSAIVVAHPRLLAARWWKRTWVWDLDDLPSENPFPPMVYAPEAIPWLRRRFGVIARYGLRARVDRDDSDTSDDGEDERAGDVPGT